MSTWQPVKNIKLSPRKRLTEQSFIGSFFVCGKNKNAKLVTFWIFLQESCITELTFLKSEFLWKWKLLGDHISNDEIVWISKYKIYYKISLQHVNNLIKSLKRSSFVITWKSNCPIKLPFSKVMQWTNSFLNVKLV